MEPEDELERVNSKWRMAFQNAMDAMPGDYVLNVMTTHAAHRAVVHFKFNDRLKALLDSMVASYRYVPPELGMDLSRRTKLLLSAYEELGECIIELGKDVDRLGHNYMNALGAMQDGLKSETD